MKNPILAEIKHQHRRLYGDCLVSISHVSHESDFMTTLKVVHEFTDSVHLSKFKFEYCPFCKEQENAAKMRRRVVISPFLKKKNRIVKILKRRDGRCVKCGTRDHLTVDHIISTGFGGAILKKTNLQLLCYNCNNRKSITKENKVAIARKMNEKYTTKWKKLPAASCAPRGLRPLLP